MNIDPEGTSWNSFWKGVGNWFIQNSSIILGSLVTVALAALSIATFGIATVAIGVITGAILGAGIGALNAIYTGDNLGFGILSGMLIGALGGLGGFSGALAAGFGAATLSLIGDDVNGRQHDYIKAITTLITATVFSYLGGKVSDYLSKQSIELSYKIAANFLGLSVFMSYNFVADIIIGDIYKEKEKQWHKPVITI